MANTLPAPAQCCTPTCDEVATVAVPGPAGENGAAGSNGTDGVNAYSSFTADFTIPAELGSAVASIDDSSWIGINQILYASKADGSVVGFFKATAVPSGISVTLQNLEDTGNNAYLDNSAPGSILTTGSKLSPAGLQGPDGATTGSAGGDLKGTYPNPNIGIGNAKGSSLWGNGTDTVAVAAGTDGHMLAYDSTDAEGVKSFKALPLTADTGVADNRVPRLDRPVGTETPSPLQASLVTITDTGAIRADGSGGNSRGTDAVDLQVNRTNATEVASGSRSVICGGENNTASGVETIVVGGDGNTAATGDRAIVVGGQSNSATGQESFIGGGQNNQCSGVQGVVSGGDGNTVSADESVVAGGKSNTASSNQAVVGGGSTNTASNTQATVAGGGLNTASGITSSVGGGTGNTANQTGATIAGGQSNTASAAYATVAGGLTNQSTGAYSSISGGREATADKYGSKAHSAGMFAAAADAQAMELVMRRATTDATPSELFLDGVSARATIPTNTAWTFQLLTAAIDSNGATAEAAGWEVKGVIANKNGTTAIVGSVTSATLGDNTGGTWAHAVTASDANDALVITVTGEAGRNIRWVSHVRLVQVTYP